MGKPVTEVLGVTERYDALGEIQNLSNLYLAEVSKWKKKFAEDKAFHEYVVGLLNGDKPVLLTNNEYVKEMESERRIQRDYGEEV